MATLAVPFLFVHCIYRGMGRRVAREFEERSARVGGRRGCGGRCDRGRAEDGDAAFDPDALLRWRESRSVVPPHGAVCWEMVNRSLLEVVVSVQ
jgi:hypothetical protein